MSAAATFWNGEPTPCRRVIVRVGPSDVPTWWCAELAGTLRRAIEVRYGRDTFYLDNEDESGWAKVTTHGGGPWASHRSLPPSEVVGDDPTPPPAPVPLTVLAQAQAGYLRDPKTGEVHNLDRAAKKALARQLGVTGKRLRKLQKQAKRQAREDGRGPTA